MSRFYALVKITLVITHCDVIAAFKASLLLKVIIFEILLFFTEKCENNALKILTHSMAGCVPFCFDGCLSPPVKYLNDRSRGYVFCNYFMFCSVLCLLCLCARLFICALWSPAGKRLTSWPRLWCLIVSLSLSHGYPGSGVELDCIDS